MTNYLIAKTGDIPLGKMLGAQIDGEKMLVANVGGQYYAMRAICNHMGGQLDKGKLEENVVTCPLHGSKWDVKTGNLVKFARPLPPEPIFKVTVVGDQIFVEK